MTAKVGSLLVGLVLTLAGCSSPPAAPAASEAPPSSVAATPEPPPAEETLDEETPSPTPQNPELNKDGGYDFGTQVTTPIGIAVRVPDVKRGKAPKPDGQGVKKGDPIVYFTFKLTNKTKKVWKGTDTQVSVLDGETITMLEEYLGAQNAGDEIGGTLPPGKSKTTRLAYAVPKSVTYLVAEVTVAPDLGENSVVFTGDLK